MSRFRDFFKVLKKKKLKCYSDQSNCAYHITATSLVRFNTSQGTLLHVIPIPLTLFPVCLFTNHSQIKAKKNF